MRQIVNFKIYLSNEEKFVKVDPTHFFTRMFSVDDKTSADDVFKLICDFEWHVRMFVNGCREVFKHVYVEKSVVCLDYNFD